MAQVSDPTRGRSVPTQAQREAFRAVLRRVREECRLSKRGLALKVGVTQSAVWQWEEGRAAPRPETAATLERVLGLDPGRLSKLLGYLPATTETGTTPGVVEAAKTDPRLGEQERELLIAVYRELVRQSAAKRSKLKERA
jgi:transcriptional regulator with XRE-family HTH domain